MSCLLWFLLVTIAEFSGKRARKPDEGLIERLS